MRKDRTHLADARGCWYVARCRRSRERNYPRSRSARRSGRQRGPSQFGYAGRDRIVPSRRRLKPSVATWRGHIGKFGASSLWANDSISVEPARRPRRAAQPDTRRYDQPRREPWSRASSRPACARQPMARLHDPLELRRRHRSRLPGPLRRRKGSRRKRIWEALR